MNKAINREQINEVLSFYDCSIDSCSIAPLGNGLINCTYLVSQAGHSFVLQRINHQVFQQPQRVIENAELINAHLQIKHQRGEYPFSLAGQIATNTDRPMVQVQGNTWRAMHYVANSYTIDQLSTVEQATQVATAFGQFTSALSDFPAEKLNEIIPNFHHLASRIAQLKAAVKADPVNRLTLCQTLVDKCLAQQDFIAQVANLVCTLPLQVTHNDTKIDNLLFSKTTDKPIAVIDLDTCMPGFIMHDFGDMVRTCCSTLPEDGTELSQMEVRLDIFQALAQAYIASFAGNITKLEQQSLITGALLLPFMVGVRFLTDFINGDSYFHTKHPLHNLERAKNQLHFFKLLQQVEPELSSIVHATRSI